MITNRVTEEVFGDLCYTATHSSGMKVIVYPKAGYASTYAMFGTAYGSIHTTFKRSDEEDFVTVPEGIAHFLEHKLFESEDGDAFARYAKTGASANAFTSFDKTCYLFSCSENFKESFEILLDFVQSPYFTQQTVQKEQGIIGQEIRMYDDNPGWKVFFNLLGGMYEKNPVKINIAGTVESIAKIDAELLYRCYRTFYNLSNMVLVVAGNCDPEEVFALADANLKECEPVTVEYVAPEEDQGIVQSRVEERMAVSVPMFQLGFKEPAGKERVTGEKLAYTEILLELLASDSSPLYRRMLDAGWINSSFGYEYLELPGCAAVVFEGETEHPDEVAAEIKKEIARLRSEGIDPAEFERARKSIYGGEIAALGSAESVARQLVECEFSHRKIGDEIRAAANATVEDIQRRLEEQLWEENCVLSLVLPKEA